MNTTTLDTGKKKVFRKIINPDNKNQPMQMTPPEGFMTGDEFERRVKERVTKFYKENGLL